MIDDRVRRQLALNWQAVSQEVADAAITCNRRPEEITIIGVSKYVDVDCTQALYEAGCSHLGESRPQSLWTKAESPGLQEGVNWHLIGHLQTNKVRRLLRHQPIIHSVDSQRLLECIARESAAQGLVTRVLLELNISGDASKTGLSAERAQQLFDALPAEGINLIGLMAMAGWGTDPKDAREQFERTRELRERWQQAYAIALPELSMGMSGDYYEAIAAGSTMVRIGTRLFDAMER